MTGPKPGEAGLYRGSRKPCHIQGPLPLCTGTFKGRTEPCWDTRVLGGAMQPCGHSDALTVCEAEPEPEDPEGRAKDPEGGGRHTHHTTCQTAPDLWHLPL